MKVLVVSPFLPYPGVLHAGGKLVYFLLQTLAGKHSVYLLSRYFPGEEGHFGELRKMLSGIELVSAPGPVTAGSLPSIWRTVWSYYRLARKAREVLNRETFDLCQVEFTETGVFWLPARDLPAVLTCHDIIAKPAFRRYAASSGFSRVLYWLTWKGKHAAEKKALSKFNRVFTLSDEDREWAERLYPRISIGVLRYPGGLGFTGLPRKEVPGRILFLGALNRPQNIESVRYFREQVWPAVREMAPEAEFWIAGGGLPRGLEQEMSGDPRTVLTGFLENVEEVYRSASVFVAPILTGGGVVVKILDAMAAGVPVVTTPFGNEGIRAKEGEEILVSDDPDHFLRNVLGLLQDRKYRTALGDAGRRFVENKFSVESFSDTLGQTYGELDTRLRGKERYSDSTSRT
jgi:glycosyltransferase involved in cell wall biosynthesis